MKDKYKLLKAITAEELDYKVQSLVGQYKMQGGPWAVGEHKNYTYYVYMVRLDKEEK